MKKALLQSEWKSLFEISQAFSLELGTMKARDREEEKPGGPLFFCLSLHVGPAAAGLRDEEGRGSDPFEHCLAFD